MAKKAAARTWQVKNSNQKKQYHTALGTTDYDIPMFGYRSALLIFTVVFSTLLFIPLLCFAIGVDYRPVTVILSSAAIGLSVGYAQFFIERKKGLCRNFWLVSTLIALGAAVIIAIMMYTGWLL